MFFTITQSKLGGSFKTTQFFIDGYSKLFKLERNRNGGRILLHVKEDIASTELKSDNIPNDIKEMFIELKLINVKWLIL